jgi:DNA-binding transcriptional LysR family regulator
MNLAWEDVRLFVSVVQAGSLRAAARSLHIDASTVSRRLSQLEESAGTRLLERSARRLKLTAAGAHLLQTGERMAQELSEVGRRIASCDRRLGGIVRVTAPSSLSALMAHAVHALGSSHPSIEVELLSIDALLSIDGNQVDVAVRIADSLPEHLVGQRVAKLHAGIYGRADAGRADPTPQGMHWVEWDRRLSGKPAFQWAAQRFPARRIVARGLGSADVHALIGAGVGIGALPRVQGDPDPRLRRLMEVPDEVSSSVWVLTHPELREVPRIRAVMAALRRVLKDARETL